MSTTQAIKKCATCGRVGIEDPIKGCTRCGFDDMRPITQATQDSVQATERVAFEAWAQANVMRDYSQSDKHLMWWGWQARAALEAQKPVAPALVGWQPIETRPSDVGSHLVADSIRGFVAPVVNGVIYNNVGTDWDWQWGESPTHWMPLPLAPGESNEN